MFSDDAGQLHFVFDYQDERFGDPWHTLEGC